MFRTYATQAQRDKAVRRLRLLSNFLDNAIRVPGSDMRIGYDAVIGLVPGVGDALTSALSMYIVYEGHRLGASSSTLAKMVGNVAIDFVVGSVPGLGDVADFFFKANRRNLILLGIEPLGTTSAMPNVEQPRATAPSPSGPSSAASSSTPASAAPRRHVPNVALRLPAH